MSLTIDTQAQYDAPVSSGGHSTYGDDSGGWLSNVDWGNVSTTVFGVWDRLSGNAVNEPTSPQQPTGTNQPIVIDRGQSGVSPVVWVLVAVVSIAVLGGFGYLIFKK